MSIILGFECHSGIMNVGECKYECMSVILFEWLMRTKFHFLMFFYSIPTLEP